MNPVEDQQYLYKDIALPAPFTGKMHKNGIVVVFLAPGNGVQQIRFFPEVTESLKGMTGKRKHGSKTVMPGTMFAEVLKEDGNWVAVETPLKARLLEVNEAAKEGDYCALFELRGAQRDPFADKAEDK